MDRIFNLLVNLGRRFYYHPVIKSILHTSVFCLSNALEDCESVLDLGCGNNSSIQYCPDKFSVGVDYFIPYLLESKRKNIHKYYIRADIEKIEFKPHSFDAVMLLSTVEHIGKGSGLKLLDKAAVFARKKVIITTPNGYIP